MTSTGIGARRLQVEWSESVITPVWAATFLGVIEQSAAFGDFPWGGNVPLRPVWLVTRLSDNTEVDNWPGLTNVYKEGQLNSGGGYLDYLQSGGLL